MDEYKNNLKRGGEDRWAYEVVLVILMVEYYEAFEGELLAFVTACMNLQDIVLSKISQALKDK